jgi:hypothetical protein
MGNETDDLGGRILGVLDQFLEDVKPGPIAIGQVGLDLAEDGAWRRGD